ncbi:MAG TPA: hypothetical protein V6C58_17440 [Allocoleopsis sp.]
MSQSSKVKKSFGEILLRRNANLRTGSTSSTNVVSTPAHTDLADASATLTVSQLKTGVLVMTPTSSSKTLTTPTAALLAAHLKNVGDSMDFSVINKGADGISVILAAGSGVTSHGFLTVRDSSATSDPDSGSSLWRLRMTNTTASSEAAVLYRLA